MNENLNLIEILKDAPKGTKLWSPICGDCILDKIDTRYTTVNYAIYCLTVNDHSPVHFTANGKYTLCFDDGECVLFPSKENRDWSTFKTLWMHKHFELGQKVLVPYHDGDIYKWRLTFYSHYDEDIKQHFTTDAMGFLDEEVIAYKGNEDKLGKAVE